jgi:hypothetical protein
MIRLACEHEGGVSSSPQRVSSSYRREPGKWPIWKQKDEKTFTCWLAQSGFYYPKVIVCPPRRELHLKKYWLHKEPSYSRRLDWMRLELNWIEPLHTEHSFTEAQRNNETDTVTISTKDRKPWSSDDSLLLQTLAVLSSDHKRMSKVLLEATLHALTAVAAASALVVWCRQISWPSRL